MPLNYKFSPASRAALATCHADLVRIAELALLRTQVDFRVVEGTRSVSRQALLYEAGKSQCDGVKRKSKHNHMPSLALDICAIRRGKASWDTAHLAYLGGVFMSVAAELLAQKRIQHRLRWGGNWDGDGEIITDQHLIDLPHFELLRLCN